MLKSSAVERVSRVIHHGGERERIDFISTNRTKQRHRDKPLGGPTNAMFQNPSMPWPPLNLCPAAYKSNAFILPATSVKFDPKRCEKKTLVKSPPGWFWYGKVIAVLLMRVVPPTSSGVLPKLYSPCTCIPRPSQSPSFAASILRYTSPL